jgi:predicted PurR-regulated permease PerM
LNHLDKLARISVVMIAVIVVFAALETLAAIFAPLALALVAGVVLSPLSDFWERRGYAAVVGALIGLVVTLALIAGFALVFQPVILQLVDQAPKVWSDMQTAVQTVRDLLRGVADVTENVSEAIAPKSDAAGAAQAAPEKVDLPSVTDAVLAAPAVLAQLLVFAGALFFFLLTRTEIYDWAAQQLPSGGERDQLARKLRHAEREVSRYFLTITMINAGLGAATAAVLQALGMPGAALWGVVGFLFNFIVYLGPALFLVALLFAGIAVFDGGLALAPAAAFLILNGIEGQFVTPALVGRNMKINPLLVFLSLVFGIWLWGPIGGVVAIPLLLWVLVLYRDIALVPPDTAE